MGDNEYSKGKKAMAWAQRFLGGYVTLAELEKAAQDPRYIENVRRSERCIDEQLRIAENYGEDTTEIRKEYGEIKSKIELILD